MDAHPSLWAGRRVLVTGCTGFLGSAVTRELLDRGAVVAGLVRGRPDNDGFARERSEGRFWTVHGRVEDAIRLQTAFAVHEVSAVFHLAAADPFGSDRGTAAVSRAAAQYHPRLPVIVARPSGQLRIAREDDTAPGLLGVARFGELFGPGDRKVLRVVPQTAIDLLAGSRGAFADGPVRDFVFVRDAARACLAVAEAVGVGGKPLDLTFRSGWEFGEREMAARVAEVFAGKMPQLGSESPESPLDWRPETPFAAAVRETIAWYRGFSEARPAATTRKAA
jgi:CDP-glucose 4,6-dehydratase